MILNKLGETPIDYIPFFVILTITILSVWLIYNIFKKHKANKLYKLQLLEEQNQLLHQLVDKEKD